MPYSCGESRSDLNWARLGRSNAERHPISAFAFPARVGTIGSWSGVSGGTPCRACASAQQPGGAAGKGAREGAEEGGEVGEDRGGLIPWLPTDGAGEPILPIGLVAILVASGGTVASGGWCNTITVLDAVLRVERVVVVVGQW